MDCARFCCLRGRKLTWSFLCKQARQSILASSRVASLITAMRSGVRLVRQIVFSFTQVPIDGVRVFSRSYCAGTQHYQGHTRQMLSSQQQQHYGTCHRLSNHPSSVSSAKPIRVPLWWRLRILIRLKDNIESQLPLKLAVRLFGKLCCFFPTKLQSLLSETFCLYWISEEKEKEKQKVKLRASKREKLASSYLLSSPKIIFSFSFSF